MDLKKCKPFQKENEVFLLPEECPLSNSYCSIYKLIPDPETKKISIDTKNVLIPKHKCSYFNPEQINISDSLLLNDYYNLPLNIKCNCTQSIYFIKKCLK